MDDKFEPLKPDEVVSLGEDWKSRGDMFNVPLTFKPKELQVNIAEQIVNYWKHYQKSRRKLFNEGLEGEALKIGADGWKKGKIRCKVVVEFCPDEKFNLWRLAMEDNLKPLECSDSGAVSFENTTYKVGFLRQVMNNSFNKTLNYYLREELQRNGVCLPDSFNEQEWFDEGIDCEILNLGSTEWKKGKVKVKFSVEFYVEPKEDKEITPKINDPDSLDDLRKELNQENS